MKQICKTVWGFWKALTCHSARGEVLGFTLTIMADLGCESRVSDSRTSTFFFFNYILHQFGMNQQMCLLQVNDKVPDLCGRLNRTRMMYQPKPLISSRKVGGKRKNQNAKLRKQSWKFRMVRRAMSRKTCYKTRSQKWGTGQKCGVIQSGRKTPPGDGIKLEGVGNWLWCDVGKGKSLMDRIQQDGLEAREGVKQETSPGSPINMSPNWVMTMLWGKTQYIKTSSIVT